VARWAYWVVGSVGVLESFEKVMKEVQLAGLISEQRALEWVLKLQLAVVALAVTVQIVIQKLLALLGQKVLATTKESAANSDGNGDLGKAVSVIDSLLFVFNSFTFDSIVAMRTYWEKCAGAALQGI